MYYKQYRNQKQNPRKNPRQNALRRGFSYSIKQRADLFLLRILALAFSCTPFKINEEHRNVSGAYAGYS